MGDIIWWRVIQNWNILRGEREHGLKVAMKSKENVLPHWSPDFGGLWKKTQRLLYWRHLSLGGVKYSLESNMQQDCSGKTGDIGDFWWWWTMCSREHSRWFGEFGRRGIWGKNWGYAEPYRDEKWLGSLRLLVVTDTTRIVAVRRLVRVDQREIFNFLTTLLRIWHIKNFI